MAAIPIIANAIALHRRAENQVRRITGGPGGAVVPYINKGVRAYGAYKVAKSGYNTAMDWVKTGKDAVSTVRGAKRKFDNVSAQAQKLVKQIRGTSQKVTNAVKNVNQQRLRLTGSGQRLVQSAYRPGRISNRFLNRVRRKNKYYFGRRKRRRSKRKRKRKAGCLS